MTKSAISRIETGNREVSLADLLALAAALDTPPAVLLAPFTRGGEVEVLPGRSLPVDMAYSWISGEAAKLPSGWPDEDVRWPGSDAAAASAHQAKGDRRRHHDLVGELGLLTGQLTYRRRAQIEAERDGDSAKARTLAVDIESQARRADHLWLELVALRQRMSSYGYVPPPLQGDLAQREADPDNALPWGL